MIILTGNGEQVCWQIVGPKAVGELLIIYGSDPHSKLPFEVAANYLAKKLKRKYRCKSLPKPMNIDNGGDLMKLLLKKREREKRIKELHIFSHSWFSGLSLNYGGTATASNLKSLEDLYGKLVSKYIGSNNFDEFKETQLRISNFQYLTRDQQKTLMDNFAPAAKIQIWGCRSGEVSSDSSQTQTFASGLSVTFGSGSGSSGLSQIFANYTRATTWGSESGTHFEVYVNEKWIKYDKEAREKYGKLVRQGKAPFMMFPGVGRKYKEFKPNKKVEELASYKLQPKVPYVLWLDKDMSKISPEPTDRSLYSIKCGETFHFELQYIDAKLNKTVTFYDNSGQVNASNLMIIEDHARWKLKGGKIELTGRNLYRAVAKAYSDYSKDKRYWIEVKWQNKSFNSKGKNEIKFVK